MGSLLACTRVCRLEASPKTLTQSSRSSIETALEASASTSMSIGSSAHQLTVLPYPVLHTLRQLHVTTRCSEPVSSEMPMQMTWRQRWFKHVNPFTSRGYAAWQLGFREVSSQ